MTRTGGDGPKGPEGTALVASQTVEARLARRPNNATGAARPPFILPFPSIPTGVTASPKTARLMNGAYCTMVSRRASARGLQAIRLMGARCLPQA